MESQRGTQTKARKAYLAKLLLDFPSLLGLSGTLWKLSLPIPVTFHLS